MFERAREIVAGADAIRSDLAALRGLLEGTVALGTMLPPGPIDLPGLLASFHDVAPGHHACACSRAARPRSSRLLRRDELDVAVHRHRARRARETGSPASGCSARSCC